MLLDYATKPADAERAQQMIQSFRGPDDLVLFQSCGKDNLTLANVRRLCDPNGWLDTHLVDAYGNLLNRRYGTKFRAYSVTTFEATRRQQQGYASSLRTPIRVPNDIEAACFFNHAAGHFFGVGLETRRHFVQGYDSLEPNPKIQSKHLQEVAFAAGAEASLAGK